MTDKLVLEAKKYFSDIRLFRYLNLAEPLSAYLNNLLVSEKLLSMISVFEVIFRNKINGALVEQFGNDYITNTKLPLFNSTEKGLVKAAIKRVNKIPLKIKEGRILTELSLGFWCALATKHTLWVNSIHKIHSNRKMVKFKNFVKRINLISDIRNKIAHHERIIKKRPYSMKSILDAITNETLLLIDDSDQDFKKYVERYLNTTSNEIRLLVSQIN